MINAKIYCLCLENSLLSKVKSINYIPVGLGSGKFSEEWLRDNNGNNISHKNSYYGEYTFHYWLWKNYLDNFQNDEWIGFCAYRRFWQNKLENLTNNFNFKNSILNNIPEEWENYDVVLGDKISLDNVKWMKVLKYGKKALLRNPKAVFKNKRNIRFQFDMFHGNGVLDKAINLLGKEDKNDFKEFVNKETSYNQGNMFICKSKKIMNNYYTTLFKWLYKCEDLFGFDLKGYGNIRIYAFLAERFLPYWFNKNTKVKEWPILFYDLRNLNEQNY